MKTVTKLTETAKFKLSDILYGLVVPLIVGIIIIAFPLVISSAVKGIIPFPLGLAGAEIILTFAIPLFMGLIWNKWAGGATGFLLGTVYYLASAGYNYVLNQVLYSVGDYAADKALLQYNLWSDLTQIGFIITAMLVGYIAGALNNKSISFKRMLGASLTAAVTVGVFAFCIKTTSPMVTDYPYVAFITLLPMIIFAVIVPIVAKVFTWYGIMPGRHA